MPPVMRFAKVVAVFTWRVLIPWLAGRRQPERLRAAFEDLGGAWTKLGQALALRFDLLPAQYCYELFKLLNSVRPFPYADVRRIVRAELGADPSEVFLEFEPEPFASASLGQVHRARLSSGELVAVKVQRPDVERELKDDIRIMYAVGRTLDAVRAFGGTRLVDVVSEFASWTEEELDYRNEARHAEVLARNADGDRGEVNAAVFRQYSTRRVLTARFIEGVPLIDVIYAVNGRNDRYLQELGERGFDLRRIASRICWNSLNQIYRHGHFHADLHPANMFVLPRNRIAYVDFGIVGALPGDVRDSLAQFARKLFAGSIDDALSELMRWIRPSARTDRARAQRHLRRALENYVDMLTSGNARQAAFSTFEIEVLAIIRRHSMSLAPTVVVYFKAVVTMTAVLYQLAPDFDLQAHENRFFSRMIRDDAASWLDHRRLAAEIFEARFVMRRVIQTILSHERLDPVYETIVSRTTRRVQWLGVLTLAAGTALYASLAYPLWLASIRLPEWTPRVLFAVMVVLLLLAVGQGRELRTAQRVSGGDMQRTLRHSSSAGGNTAEIGER